MMDIRRSAETEVLAHYGLAKTAAKPNAATFKALRDLYLREGALAGGIRGGLSGGLIGALTADEHEDRLARAIRGAGIGTIGGGLAGAGHGYYLTSSPTRANKLLFSRKVVGGPTNSTSYYLRRPGRFLPENIAVTYHPGDFRHAHAVKKLKHDKNLNYVDDPHISDFASDVLEAFRKNKNAGPAAAPAAPAAPAAKSASLRKTALDATPEEIERARRIVAAAKGVLLGGLKGVLAGGVGGGVIGGLRGAFSDNPSRSPLDEAIASATHGAALAGLGGALTGGPAGYFKRLE